MSDDAYNKKLVDLQKYIPFMENMIAQLKDPKWKPREAQLNKMESLYNMITDRNKKWKYDTLLKCEEVIMKLQSKVKANRPIFPAEKKDQHTNSERSDNVSNTVTDIMNALKFNNARVKLNCEMSTPKSPSPIRDVLPLHSPKIIPFEATNEPIRKSTNIVDPNELSVTWNCDRHDRYVNEKPDIYSSAAKSLCVQPSKISIFDRLGPVVPEATSDRPLLSDADLEMLREGEDLLVLCQNDRQKQSTPKQDKSLQDLNSKISPRITPVPASKPKTKTSENATTKGDSKSTKKTDARKEEKHKHKEKESSKSKSPKSEKLTTFDIFGNCLSSIDNKILEDSKKKDKRKDEKRHSVEHKKDKHHDSKHHHESKHHHHHKHKDKDKKKEGEKIEDPRLKNEKDKIKEPVDDKPIEKLEVTEKQPEEKPLIPIDIPPEKPKRLADKYNPKPRKHVETDSSQESISDSCFESRDPRKRPPSLLPTPTSLLGVPPFPPAIIPSLNPFPLNNSRNIIPNIPNITAIPPHLPVALQQQPALSPKPVPLMALNLQPPLRFQSPPLQSWVNDTNADYTRPLPTPLFEPPPKLTDPRRQSFQENLDRPIVEVRRQPKFSPPPPISPVQSSPFVNAFIPPIYNSPQPPMIPELNFVPPLPRNIYEVPSSSFQQSRFEVSAGRFDPPIPTNHTNQNTIPRKNFCPFEPLDSARDKEEERALSRRNEMHPGGFRSNYSQYNRFDRISDRYGRKPKTALREDAFPKVHKDRLSGENDDKQRPKCKDSDPDVSTKETHTKYDEIYSKLDTEKETFSSPLESLYSNAKTSVKSIQSFKIPKKPKPEPPPKPSPVIEDHKFRDIQERTEGNIPKSDNYKDSRESSAENSTKANDKNIKNKSKSANTSDDTDSEDDDIPLWKRVKRRSKTINKSKIIDDSDEEEECEDEEKEAEVKEEEEAEEDSKEEEPVRSRRVTRQSAIKANKLITTRKAPVRNKKGQKSKPKPKSKRLYAKMELEEQLDEQRDEEDVTEVKDQVVEAVDVNCKDELTDNENKEIINIEINKKEDLEAIIGGKISQSSILTDIKPKEEEVIVEKEEPKEPDEVQKARDELLTEAKKKNLNLNDQGAEVLQFILMNYKKIKKIFRSDSSSDEDEKERKKKKRKRDKSSSSDDEKETKEKTKHKEKHSSDDEKEVKEKKKNKEKQVSEDEEKEKPKTDTIHDSEDEKQEGEKSEAKQTLLEDNEKQEEIEKVPVKEDVHNESKEAVLEETIEDQTLAEDTDAVEQAQIEEEVQVTKPPIRKIKKGNGPKGKLLDKKVKVASKQTLISPAKKARRSELDKLHDDIKEMLMGGEVLTSTGKRACTMPKEDTEEFKKDSNDDLSTAGIDQNSPVIPAKSVRVLLEKTNIEKLLIKETNEECGDNKQESGEIIVPMPKLEKMVSTQIRKFAKKKILRKKKHRWATGFLKRKNKRKMSGSEDKIEEDGINSFVGNDIIIENSTPANPLHDKDYFNRGARSFCKLCPFKGKLIIQHYRSVHPDDEVIISRMEPTVTEHLMNEARENNYDSIVLKDVPSQRKKRFGYKCPFTCPLGTTMDFCENYYDHITSHTGEHRYFCPFCSFSTSNSRNLRAHMVPQHNSNLENYGKPLTPAPPASKYLFGYVCRQCHFVQIRKDSLEKHLEDYHDNQGEIVKVNLSLVCMEIEEVDARTPVIVETTSPTKQILNRQDHMHESIESVVSGAGIIKTPEPSLVKDLNIFELMKQIEADESPPVLVKVEPIETEPDLDALIPEISIEVPPAPSKQADLTAFMCKSDLPVDDELTIEQKRLKKMNEIHENFKPSRTSIVDRLQSRLDSNAQEKAAPSVSATSAPSTSSFVVVNASKPPPLVPLDRSKKSLEAIPKNLVPPELVMAPKKAAPISSIINRLQDKLLPTPTTSKQISISDQEDTESPSKKTHVSSALNIGPITVTFDKNSEILYSCFIPFCVFNTTKASVFEYHCREAHRDYVYTRTKCDVCEVKIEHDEDFVTMFNLYQHISTSHADFINTSFTNEKDSEAANDDIVPESSIHINEVSISDESNLIPQSESDSGTKYPFLITNVTSVDPQPSTSGVQEKFTKFTLPHDVPNLISQADNDTGPKFPFVITSVTSLAKKRNRTPSPPASLPLQILPITTTPPTLLNSLASTVQAVTTFVALTPISSAPIQTSPSTKPYTIASLQAAPAIVPIILNPLAPENESGNKIQLPVISCVQSLAPPKKDAIRPVPINQLTSSKLTTQLGPSTSEKRPSNIINVVSLISSDGKTLTLKDIPMTMQEKMAPRKSKVAKEALLQPENVVRFYKCPQFFCFYATDKPQDLLMHLSTHKELANTFTFCLHCDYKTSYKLYMVHLEVHHGCCDYACGRCFYRTTNAAFVMAHSKLRHKEEPLVIKTPRENMPTKINTPKLPPLKSILKHYVCGEPGCGLKTIFSNVYFEHIQTVHLAVSKVTCGICKITLASMSTHWGTHNVHAFHCRYCKVGSKSLDEIVNHQSTVHFKNDYCVVYRRFVPNPIYPERTALSYNVKDDATYDRLYLIYGGNGVNTNTTVEGDNLIELPFPKSMSPQQSDDRNSPFLTVNISEQNCNALEDKSSDESCNDLVIDTDASANTDEPEIPVINGELDEAVTDPLSFDIRDTVSDDDLNEEADTEISSGKYDPNATKHNEEYSGAMLYKCTCGLRFEDRVKFKGHVLACQEANKYKCVHCGLQRKSIRTLLTHMNEHGRKRYKCSLCQYKHFTKKFVKDHMTIEHKVFETILLPAAVTKKIDYSKDDFVLRPKLSGAKKVSVGPPFGEAPTVNKTIFFPKDMDQLPRPPIYQKEVYCGVCNYATKVKSNILRHLQAHKNEQAVSETAPVNPVPCLEKSEKMFDKMVNLALSSHSSGKTGTAKMEKGDESHIPTFVPINKRFVCGADNCNYLCPEEGMIRRHLTTFHSQELNYTCLHCNNKIFEDKLINVDMILKHLKLHDAHLYGCGYCKFIHNLKHKVERHTADKHANQPSSYVIIREVVKETDKEVGVTAEKDDGKKPWRCGMCKFKCANIEEMKSHTQVKHNVNAKNKCSLCEYGSEEVNTFGKHFEMHHIGQAVDMIVSYYKEEEVVQRKPEADPEFNTTPLWQRNKSIKHIRGILLEETNNKIPKTPGPKKTKLIKAKKLENAAFASNKSDSSADASSLTASSPSVPGKSGIVKKSPPKRRKSNAGNKGTILPKKASKTNNSKDVAGGLIVIGNPTKINSKMFDVVNIDEVAKKKQPKPGMSVLKQNPIVISNKNANINAQGSNDSVNSNATNNSNQKPKILSVSYFKVDLKDTNFGSSESSQNKSGVPSTPSRRHSDDVIEIFEDKVGNDESPDKKMDDLKPKQPSLLSNEKFDVIEKEISEIIDISDDKVTTNPVSSKKSSASETMFLKGRLSGANKPSKKRDVTNTAAINKSKKATKSKTDISQIPVTCNINLDDSSTEDSDIMEITNESDPLAQSTSPKSEPTTPNEDVPSDDPLVLNPNLDSSLKNIKVVSVCSLKGTVAKSADEIDVDVELIEDADEIPAKRSQLDITLGEIEAMSKSELLNGNFVGTYGPFGSPWSGSYKCPLCEKFLSGSAKDFTAHMHQELQYGMYKCASCDYRNSDQSAVVKHHEKSHEDMNKEDMVIMEMDQQIEDWVAKLLVFQTRILTLDKEEVRCYCNFCDYKCDNPSDMRKHRIRHWSVKPYTCSNCKYETVTRAVLEKHVKRCHSGVDVKIIESEIGESVIIKRIRWNGRTEKSDEAYQTYETFEMDGNLDEVKDVLLSCCYCYTRGKLDELRTHFTREHPKEQLKVHRYRCNYCTTTTLTLRTLDQHFISCHSGMHRNYTEVSDQERAYRCLQCPVSDDKCVAIKEHLRSHYKTIKCLYCDLTVVYWKTLRKHYRDVHSVTNFEFLYLLSVEQAYEKELVRVKKIASCLNVNSAGNASKKRKRVDEDAFLIENSPTYIQEDTPSKIEEKPPPKMKQTARKSTGGYSKPTVESNYGKKPDGDDYANIITTVDVMGMPVTMNIVKLSKILDISPIVLVKDCENNL